MKTSYSVIDKFGVVGAVTAAMMMPCCLPLLGIAGTTLGLGALDFDEELVQIAVQGMMVLSIGSAAWSYREHQQKLPLAFGVLSLLLVLIAFHFVFEPILVYAGLTGISVMAILNTVEHRRHALCCKPSEQSVQVRSTITCPHCGFAKEETMPSDACQFFYECTNCHIVLRPKEGDCCVYCSYGTIPCPPIQLGNVCC